MNMNKKQKKPRKPHLVLRSIAMLLSTAFLVLAIGVSVIANQLSGMLDAFANSVKVDVSRSVIEETAQAAEALAVRVEGESAVLLENNGTLPLRTEIKQVNVFGWASTAWLGGGSGSGGVSSVNVDLLGALEQAGIAYNQELTQMYRDFQAAREYPRTLNSWPEQSCRLYEPSIGDRAYYTEALLTNAKAYSDTAIVVIGRQSGESNDGTLEQYKRLTKDGEIQVDASRTYLNLSTEETELLAYVGENFENVVVLLNTANAMALGELQTIPGIDACLLVGFTGQNGAQAIPALLWGEINPSGKTVDTWAYDFATAASFANAARNGVGRYENAEGLYPWNGTTCGNLGESTPYTQVSFQDYAEGIYIGYKWYETADAEGYWDDVSNGFGTGYEGVVQYPFGYGLSYTSFSWEVTQTPQTKLNGDGTVSVQVLVTNTGSAAGNDVVELYYTAPYISGQIEKSAVELGAFAKTELLAPGESQTVTLEFPVWSMASYDCYDANSNGFTGYELDEGDYVLPLRRDAHSVEIQFTCTLSENVQYPTDPVTGLTVDNKFTGPDAMDGVSLDGSDSDQNIVYLTRTDFHGTFPQVTEKTRLMADNVAALNLYTGKMADAWIDETAAPITTGAKNGLKIEENGQITELGYRLGANYDDPQWEDLLDQLTMKEMEELVLHGYAKTAALKSVGKSLVKEADGPAQIGGFTGMGAGTGFPSSSTLAQSWNAPLAAEEGRMIGKQAVQNGYNGWYAPAVNMHRSPFNGRNYEYYSEDSLLSGVLCGSTVAGSLNSGVYSYIKHFICNDGESYIYRDSIYTWMTEQTLRQTYLRPFQIAIEQYGATGLMSAYNRIGALWAGGSPALLTGVLRQEWDFRGTVITDYSDHHEYMNGDQMLRAGGDLWMDGFGGSLTCETESNSYAHALRRASKNILYMYLNARVENRNYAEQTGDTAFVRPRMTSGTPIWRYAAAALVSIAALLFFLALRALILDIRAKRGALKH